MASGRLVSSLKRNYDRVTPNQPAIVINGAGIYDYKQEKNALAQHHRPKGQAIC